MSINYIDLFHEIYNRGAKDPRRTLDDVTVEVFVLFNIPLEDSAKHFLKIPIHLRKRLRKLYNMSEGRFPIHQRSKEGGLRIYRNGKSKSWKVVKTGHGHIEYFGSRKSKEAAEELLAELKAKETK